VAKIQQLILAKWQKFQQLPFYHFAKLLIRIQFQWHGFAIAFFAANRRSGMPCAPKERMARPLEKCRCLLEASCLETTSIVEVESLKLLLSR